MKRIYILSVLLFAYQIITAQGFRLDDPNIIYKDTIGKVLTLDAVKAIAGKGVFSMKQRTLKNGKIEITIIPTTNKEIEIKNNNEKSWSDSWKEKAFPDFKLKTLENSIISNANLEGKIGVINFWFVSCKPCVEEIPKLNRLVDKFKNEPVAFIAPSIDNKKTLEFFSNEKEFSYQILMQSKKLNKALGIISYPTHIIIDKKGKIREIIFGASDNIDLKLEESINRILHTEK